MRYPTKKIPVNIGDGKSVNVSLVNYGTEEKPRYSLTTGNTAKIICACILNKYPHLKLDRRSDSYSGGDSLRITVNGFRSLKELEEITTYAKKFEAGSFDGMTDSYTYVNNGISFEYSGQKFNVDIKYIFTEQGEPAYIEPVNFFIEFNGLKPLVLTAANEEEAVQLRDRAWRNFYSKHINSCKFRPAQPDELSTLPVHVARINTYIIEAA